ncbi:MAG: hypothetical protein NT145_04695 [Elusimicrobia bacterium]|nr:hypothetical protein [Elusimicrobiota bacterium]
MKSKIKIGLIFSAIILIFYLIPGEKKALYDIITGEKMDNFKLVWPFSRYLLEPFVGFEEYIFSLYSYGFQLISWISWIFISVLIGCINRKNLKVADAIKYFLFSVLIFLSLITFTAIAPLPAPLLKTPPEYLKADFHAHTYYSFDTITSPHENLKFHQNNGYDFFFVTDHRGPRGFNSSAELQTSGKAFPGMQIRALEGNALLVLGDKNFDGKQFWGKTNKEIIELAHSKGLLVICPHWWKFRIPPIEQLYNDGVDGFEIYNFAYKNISEKERNKIIELCRQKNLLMVGVIDWHGWAWAGNVWTVIKKEDDKIKTNPAEYLKNNRKTSVVVYKKSETQNRIRYIFEPFFGIYYYFSGINLLQSLIWILWILFFLWASRFIREISIFLGAVFILSGIYYTVISFSVEGNKTIMPLLVPILAVLGLGWFAVWGTNLRKNKQ